MTSILSHGIFIHIPKTGGTWIAKALEEAELLVVPSKKSTRHCTIRQTRQVYGKIVRNKKFFTFVRNPVTWYQSRWTDHYARNNPHFKVKIDTSNWPLCGPRTMHDEAGINTPGELESFNKWATRMVIKHPGWLTNYYRYYMGRYYGKIKIIGRTENLQTDLVKILSQLGEEFDPQVILNLKPENQGVNLNRKWDSRVLKRIIQNEYEFMSNFNYSTSLDDYQHLLLD